MPAQFGGLQEGRDSSIRCGAATYLEDPGCSARIFVYPIPDSYLSKWATNTGDAGVTRRPTPGGGVISNASVTRPPGPLRDVSCCGTLASSSRSSNPSGNTNGLVESTTNHKPLGSGSTAYHQRM